MAIDSDELTAALDAAARRSAMGQPTSKPTVADLRQRADETAAAWGFGMGEWERGRVSGHELGVMKRRMNAAQNSLRLACYVDEKAAQVAS